MQYQLVNSGSIAEFIIKKSKFIASLYYLENEEQIKEKLLEFKKEHKDANHICYAYVLPSKEKYFDDDEPSGTAGLPILNLLKQNKLVNVLAVVIRYFGGVKLGSGGLIRAYANATKEALKLSEFKPFEVYKELEFATTYEELPLINHLKEEEWFQIAKKEFNEKVIITFTVKEEKIDELKQLLNTLFKR
ncbi:MAG: YigZ family protein [Tenericutes bacterium HGW-Tenericutes-4]|nr:MAG: YigZ family protein [Tenericutes bacterium HGW-Tenericutes-4]